MKNYPVAITQMFWHVIVNERMHAGGGDGLAREDVLFQRLRQGDSAALDELIRAFYPEIFRYCLWHTPDRQTAEDATQETFFKAVRHLDAYTHRGKFRAFLYQIAANTCTDLWRKAGKPEPPAPDTYIEPGFSRAEGEIDLQRLLSVLPEKQREVVLLRYVHDLKLKEIAEILHEPLRTVQSRLRTALKTLKTAVKGERG